MEPGPGREALTLDSFPEQLPRWRERTRGAWAAQLRHLLRLAASAHPQDAYGRSDLLVMAAGRADDLGHRGLAGGLLALACAFEEDRVLSARAHLLRRTLDLDGQEEARQLSEAWRRDRSCSVRDHGRIAQIWADRDDHVYAWGWCQRGLLLAEELGVGGVTLRGLLHLRADILACLDREPPEPLDPGCLCLSCAPGSWVAA
ncbi:hypothetical protein [Ornithinimicrobium pekingense]|uniref:Uncharacterized protein n=1 Tax=Ornithinimicrobium pekingense TaxID=384677 RepID=A0ABQ2F3S9_9MICO|nr:hypothetical protein [Ornithinimicrobium pekingense]GGK57879.1 hypothetical protein GCM10011509_02890 [Ornithinimicrobium pekingense]